MNAKLITPTGRFIFGDGDFPEDFVALYSCLSESTAKKTDGEIRHRISGANDRWVWEAVTNPSWDSRDREKAIAALMLWLPGFESHHNTLDKIRAVYDEKPSALSSVATGVVSGVLRGVCVLRTNSWRAEARAVSSRIGALLAELITVPLVTAPVGEEKSQLSSAVAAYMNPGHDAPGQNGETGTYLAHATDFLSRADSQFILGKVSPFGEALCDEFAWKFLGRISVRGRVNAAHRVVASLVQTANK